MVGYWLNSKITELKMWFKQNGVKNMSKSKRMKVASLFAGLMLFMLLTQTTFAVGNQNNFTVNFTNNSTSPTGSRNHLASFRFKNTFRLNVWNRNGDRWFSDPVGEVLKHHNNETK